MLQSTEISYTDKCRTARLSYEIYIEGDFAI